jgi:hypothetical protein
MIYGVWLVLGWFLILCALGEIFERRRTRLSIGPLEFGALDLYLEIVVQILCISHTVPDRRRKYGPESDRLVSWVVGNDQPENSDRHKFRN